MPQRSESLKMLDSEEGQLNAVFACFGFAAQYAQLFEAGLVRFLIVYNKISAESLTLEDFETIESNLQKRTMGQLIRELSRYVNFQDLALAGHFDDALQKRNFLMHRFFLARNKDLESEESRMGLLAELLTIQRELEQAGVLINAMRIAMCETLGFEENESK